MQRFPLVSWWSSANFDRWTISVGQVVLKIPLNPPPPPTPSQFLTGFTLISMTTWGAEIRLWPEKVVPRDCKLRFDDKRLIYLPRHSKFSDFSAWQTRGCFCNIWALSTIIKLSHLQAPSNKIWTHVIHVQENKKTNTMYLQFIQPYACQD